MLHKVQTGKMSPRNRIDLTAEKMTTAWLYYLIYTADIIKILGRKEIAAF